MDGLDRARRSFRKAEGYARAKYFNLNELARFEDALRDRANAWTKSQTFRDPRQWRVTVQKAGRNFSVVFSPVKRSRSGRAVRTFPLLANNGRQTVTVSPRGFVLNRSKDKALNDPFVLHAALRLGYLKENGALDKISKWFSLGGSEAVVVLKRKPDGLGKDHLLKIRDSRGNLVYLPMDDAVALARLLYHYPKRGLPKKLLVKSPKCPSIRNLAPSSPQSSPAPVENSENATGSLLPTTRRTYTPDMLTLQKEKEDALRLETLDLRKSALPLIPSKSRAPPSKKRATPRPDAKTTRMTSTSPPNDPTSPPSDIPAPPKNATRAASATSTPTPAPDAAPSSPKTPPPAPTVTPSNGVN